MAIVIGATMVGIAKLRRADLTTTSGVLDSAVRYLYQLASIHGTPCRLVVDMEGNTWWAEVLDADRSPCSAFTVKDVRRKEVRIKSGREGSRRGGFGGKGRKEKEREEEESLRCPEEEKDAEGKCPAQGFGELGGRLLKKRELPQGISFTGVMTTHQQDLQEQGRGYVYFFPNGNVEKAYIYLSSQEDTYTIETFPLLGKVKVHHEKLNLRDVLREE